MQLTSVAFYFVLMALFLFEGALLAKLLPLQRELNVSDSQSSRVPTLDGLRGVLALSVFLHHALLYYFHAQRGIWQPVPSNFYAQMGVLPVNVFFFITGYLFWTKLMKRRSIPFFPFVRDRLARLGGAYWVACLVLFLLVAGASGFHRQVSWAKLAAQTLAWFSFLGAGHDMNGVQDSRFWFGQVWTLRMEWMFYLSLPFLGWFAHKRARLALLLAFAGALAVLTTYLTFGGAANYLWKTLGGYAESLALTFSVGMLVAILPANATLRVWARSWPATALSVLLIGLTALRVPAEYGWLESSLLALPFACVCLGNSWAGLLVSPAMRSLGRVSYSFYLLHGFVLHIGLLLLLKAVPLASLTPVRYWTFAAVCGVVAVFVSFVSYRYLEHPLLHGFPRRQGTRGSFSAVLPMSLPHVEGSAHPS